MGISKVSMLWAKLCILSVIVQIYCTHGFCLFGPSTDKCLLPCRCSSPCNNVTGHCEGNQCAEDPFLKAHEVDGRTYWTGDACQTGNVAMGKHAEQIGTYYNSGFKINATADKAVDGNISTYAYSRTNRYGWWMVDLELEHTIEHVYITANNLGNSLILLTNYSVWVGNNPDVFTHNRCGLAPSPLEPGYRSSNPLQWNKVECEEPRSGRYVSIRKTENDESKKWIPIHEAVIIGYPISSVRLGYCVRYDQNFGSDLQKLKCDECVQGWLLPDCRQPVTGSTTSTTSVRATLSSVKHFTTSPRSSSSTSSWSKTTATTSTSGYATDDKTIFTELVPDTHDSVGNQVTTWIIIGSSFAVLGFLLIVAFIIILAMCCSRKRQGSPNVPQNSQGPVYFKPPQENAQVGNTASPHMYAGMEPSNEEDGSTNHTMPNGEGYVRYTNPIHDGSCHYENSEGAVYNNTDTFRDNGGYITLKQSVKTGEANQDYLALTGEKQEHIPDHTDELYCTIPDRDTKGRY